ncbi:MAG: hypothetical protein ABIG09_06075 [bacterium]
MSTLINGLHIVAKVSCKFGKQMTVALPNTGFAAHYVRPNALHFAKPGTMIDAIDFGTLIKNGKIADDPDAGKIIMAGYYNWI